MIFLLMHYFFQMPVVDANSTVVEAPALPPAVHVHAGSLSPKHGLRHHKLTTLHNPQLSSLLSESAESAEVVPVAPAVVDAPAAGAPAADPAAPAADPAAPVADPAPAEDDASASDASASVEVPLILRKRDVPAAPAPVVQLDPISLVPICPGRIRFF